VASVVVPARNTVLVTGCSSGLGRAIACGLQAAGWRVLATARAAGDLAALQALGLTAIDLDLRSSQDVERAVAKALEHGAPPLDALVNNAGFTQFGAVEDLTRDEIREQFETNVFGAIELTSRLMPSFRRAGGAKIVFISSVCGRFSLPYFGGYSASKFALEAFADAMRRETRASGVRVQVIEPGLFRTRGFETTVRRFRARSPAGPSAHDPEYARTLGRLEKNLASVPEHQSSLVVQAVREFVEGRSTKARRIVPARSLVYEIARSLPDSVQDRLVAWRSS
jgi:NAD(P)-dependent dehydrogenase (short-subunit alcohol dehydrogenase family)